MIKYAFKTLLILWITCLFYSFVWAQYSLMTENTHWSTRILNNISFFSNTFNEPIYRYYWNDFSQWFNIPVMENGEKNWNIFLWVGKESSIVIWKVYSKPPLEIWDSRHIYHPDITLGHNWSSCETTSARFYFHEYEYNEDWVSKVALDFERTCNYWWETTVWSLRINSNIPSSCDSAWNCNRVEQYLSQESYQQPKDENDFSIKTEWIIWDREQYHANIHINDEDMFFLYGTYDEDIYNEDKIKIEVLDSIEHWTYRFDFLIKDGDTIESSKYFDVKSKNEGINQHWFFIHMMWIKCSNQIGWYYIHEYQINNMNEIEILAIDFFVTCEENKDSKLWWSIRVNSDIESYCTEQWVCDKVKELLTPYVSQYLEIKQKSFVLITEWSDSDFASYWQDRYYDSNMQDRISLKNICWNNRSWCPYWSINEKFDILVEWYNKPYINLFFSDFSLFFDENKRVYEFDTSTDPKIMYVTWESRSCSIVRWGYYIHELQFKGEFVSTLAIDFWQNCSGNANTEWWNMRGSIRYNSSIATSCKNPWNCTWVKGIFMNQLGTQTKTESEQTPTEDLWENEVIEPKDVEKSETTEEDNIEETTSMYSQLRWAILNIANKKPLSEWRNFLLLLQRLISNLDTTSMSQKTIDTLLILDDIIIDILSNEYNIK